MRTLLLLLVLTGPAAADTFRVTADGTDAADRDGKAAAWASLAYACERVPAGPHTIEIGPGTFTCARTAFPKSGVTIQGAGADQTKLIASTDWPLPAKVGEFDEAGDERCQREYLIAARRVTDLAVRDLELCSPADRRIPGGVYVRDGKRVALDRLRVRHFAWNGLRLEFSEALSVAHCHVEDGCRQKKDGGEGGHVRTRWLTNSRLHHNRIVSTDGKGYGYKGGGHVGVRFDHNYVDTGYFAFESAHENEYGVEIDHNHLTRCISVPKSGPSEDPTRRGHPYTFWVHDNLLTDSYTVEGPRNHLRVSHNHVRIDKPGGRVYTHHGGVNHGPVWIDRNVIENVDRAAVWMNAGLAENITFAHNTVTCADAGDRTGVLFDSYTADRLNGWTIANNVFIAPAARPRQLFPTARGVPTKVSATNNLLVNVSGPDGNLTGDPGFAGGMGAKPWAYYRPAAGSPLIDRGGPLPKPFWGALPGFVGTAADVGAVEFGEAERAWEVPDGKK